MGTAFSSFTYTRDIPKFVVAQCTTVQHIGNNSKKGRSPNGDLNFLTKTGKHGFLRQFPPPTAITAVVSRMQPVCLQLRLSSSAALVYWLLQVCQSARLP
ncbi:hypothetical protein FXO37_13464 [Capsicum annuum]|nr:hypothetical protein FXO37_13464 [Capsicum annuum]